MISTAPVFVSEDISLATQIAARLADTRRASLRQLAVDVSPGKVTLRGSVASFYEKQIAIETCRTRAGAGWLIDAAQVVALAAR
jgi:osmotically-inducible protein OsmY